MTRSPAARSLRLATGLVAVIGLSVAAARIVSPSHEPAQPASKSARFRVAEINSFSTCVECHKDLDRSIRAGKAGPLVFEHGKHFAKGEADCVLCHPPETHVRDTTSKPTMYRCFSCHGVSKVARAPGACKTCHPPGYREPPKTHGAASFLAKHGEVRAQAPSVCAGCHTEEQCAACHVVEMPHPEGWKDLAHARSFFDDGAKTCDRCHPRGRSAVSRDFCDTCHHNEGDKAKSWLRAHPDVVSGGLSGTCFACHAQATCSACHSTGKEDFSKDEARIAKT
ncbi:MAG: cytochrome c3 family protein [Actinomycetota bacterium]